jgi:soluble P-type ATPase
MLREAVLGIAIVMQEGAAVDAVLAADVVFADAATALSFLSKSDRMRATLRG